MRVERHPTAHDAAARVVDLIEATVRARPDALLALPTGRTPLAAYRLLRESGDDLSRIRVVNLDEYIGLPQTDERSYAAYLRRELTGTGVAPGNLHLIDGLANDPEKEADRVESLIDALGGIDLAITGSGLNGHIAFNEPGAAFSSRTRVVFLSAQTRRQNGKPFGGLSPPRAITLGLGTLADARALVILATGAHKAETVKRMLESQPSEAQPATALSYTPYATLVLDKEAAMLSDC